MLSCHLSGDESYFSAMLRLYVLLGYMLDICMFFFGFWDHRPR